MTTLNVNLTSTLQTTLGGTNNGVWAYAYYFTDSGATAHSTTLVQNGAIQSSGSTAIDLPAPYVGGKVYFLVASTTDTSGTAPNLGITQESDINWGNAEANNYRFDSFEVTLSAPTAPAQNDVGNLTSVNYFGLPMELKISYADGSTATRGYAVDGSTLISDLAALSPGGSSPPSDEQTVFTYDGGALDGLNRMAIAPATSLGLAANPSTANNPGAQAFTASYWDDYLDDVGGFANEVQIAGFFNGTKDANGVFHNGGFYNYSLSYDSGSDTFKLDPAANSEIKGSIQISSADLGNSIFATLGSMDILTAAGSTFLSENTAWNDQWGTVMTQVLTGFTAGYYGTMGTYPVPDQMVDLNQNWNWDPTFAFGNDLATRSANHTYDPYAEAFFKNTNSYGGNYSDNLTAQFDQGGPLVSVADSASADVATIDLTIFDDSETPTGYTPTKIYNEPRGAGIGGGSGLAVPFETPDETSGLNFKLNFSYADMVLDPETKISLDVYEGESGGTAVWSTIELDTLAPEPWAIWTVVKDANDSDVPSFSASLGGADQGTGQLLITGLPADEPGTYWYRINVGSDDDKKTFNLYAEIVDEGGQLKFVNPNVDGQEGAIAIDGLAKIATDPTAEFLESFTVNFIDGGAVSVDPDLFVRDTHKTMNPNMPNAPVAGTLGTDGTFTALSGQTTAANTTTITSTGAELAFGWTGDNNASGTPSWISGYTNKIGATNTALVSLEAASGLNVSPLAAVADLDGKWTTGSATLSNGTYTVTMQEFLASDTSYETPLASYLKPNNGGVAYESQALTVNVDIPELGLKTGADGSISLDDSGSSPVGGNWLSFDVVNSASLAVGTSVVLYATTADGLLVNPTTGATGSGVSLEDATLGFAGDVRSDGGSLMTSGPTDIYLDSDYKLNFATVSANGTVTLDTPVTFQSDPSGDLNVNVGGYQLSVEAENTLSDDALLALGQLQTGNELTYLENGQTLRVDLSTSSANTNRLGFVEFDIDPTSGAWSVGGVAYSDSEEFANAVLNNLDGGISISAGGEVHTETVMWTVEGDDGYYAPVLVTPGGEVLVIGDANPGGNEQIRSFGNNLFGFEDLTAAEGSDFDFNDMVMKITTVSDDALV